MNESKKPTLLQRVACACGFHSWEDVQEQQCAAELGGVYEDFYYWRKCKHCGHEEDERCDVCKEHGTQACIDSWKQGLRTKRDLCRCQCNCYKDS